MSSLRIIPCFFSSVKKTIQRSEAVFNQFLLKHTNMSLCEIFLLRFIFFTDLSKNDQKMLVKMNTEGLPDNTAKLTKASGYYIL